MSSPPPGKIQIVDEKDCFYFESDHLALKGNKDYGEVLKTLFTLEAQRSKLLKDYEDVVKLKNQALENPMEIVEKLKKGESLNVPELMHIAEVPQINWSKYNISIPAHLVKEINNEALENSSTPTQNMMFQNSHRTRTKKTWTFEEQKRLEELLVQYPPEAVELSRFRKIANALGNTTVKQVCSRVQKYFVKLYKMGLPVPGRIPKSLGKRKGHKHQRHNHFLFKPSTFFPQLNVPVSMDDFDAPGPSQNHEPPQPANHNYLLPNASLEDREYEKKSDGDLQIYLLKRVKSDKMRMNDDEPSFQHVGFSCDYCKEEPIWGTRWHCSSCMSESVDFCTDCVIAQIYTEERHPLNHKLVRIRETELVSDVSNSSDSEEEEDEEEDEDEESESSDDFMDDTPDISSQPSTSAHEELDAIGANLRTEVFREGDEGFYNYHKRIKREDEDFSAAAEERFSYE